MTASSIRRIAGVTASFAVIVAVTGCSVTPWHGSWRFDDLDAAKASDESFRIPELVPDDATDMRMFADMREFGLQLSFETDEGITAEYCEPSAVTGGSVLDSGWWPEDVPAEGWTCGWWEVFESGGTVYAWDTREPVDESS